MNDPNRYQLVMLGTCLWAAASILLASNAHAGAPAKAPQISEAQQPVGTWRFKKHNRSVKVIAMGGSSTAYYRGNYGKFMEMACKNVEVKNLGKVGLSINDLKTRYNRQVAKNRHMDRRSEIWIMARGGLNSIFNPARVNWYMSKLFRSAKRHGFKTLGLSLSPWGHERDRSRWAGVAGLKTKRATRLTVDYLLGRLTPAQALGKYAKSATWQAGEIPDIAVDLYDSAMRTKKAAKRDPKTTRALLAKERWVRRQLKTLAPAERTKLLDRLVAETTDIPQWYLRKKLQAFDPIHPNTAGHREIAKAACPKLPSNWGCDCKLMDRIVWGKKGLEVRVRTASNP